MNKNTYLNVLVTVILIVMAVLCFVFVSALDQLRFAMEDMNRSMKNIESRLAGLRVVSAISPRRRTAQAPMSQTVSTTIRMRIRGDASSRRSARMSAI